MVRSFVNIRLWLRSLCAAILAIHAVTAIVVAQDDGGMIAISPRVGDTIDAAEGRYFGLFPRAGDYTFAVVSRAGDNRITAHVYGRPLPSAPDTSFVLPEAAITMLRRYVDEYEGLFDNAPHAEIDWQLLSGIARPTSPVVDDAPTFVVEATRHRTISGIVVYADSTILIMGPPSLLKQPGDMLSKAVLLLPSEIVGLRDNRGWFEHMFYEEELPVRRNDTAYWKWVLPQLAGRTMIVSETSPELRRVIAGKLGTSVGPSPFAKSVDEIVDAVPFRRFHVTIAWSAGMLPPSPRYLRTMSVHNPSPGEDKRTVDVLPPTQAQWVIGAEYEPVRSLRIGLRYIPGGGFHDVPDTASEFERYRFDAFELGARGVLRGPDVFGVSFIDHLEVSVGGSLVMSRIFSEGRITVPVDPMRGLNYSDAAVAMGSVVMIGIAYYPAPAISINFESRFATSSQATVPAHEHKGTLTSTEIDITHAEYQLSPLGGSILAGIGIHF